MSTSSFPEVRTAAVVITRGAEFLTIFNPKWGAFTLPMSKRRSWHDPQVQGASREEEPRAAAIRAAAEALGRPFGPDELPRPIELADLQPFQQSDRDGAWKSYRFDVFGIELAAGEVPAPSGGAAFAWMTLDALRTACPVSPTAIRIVEAVHAAAVLRGDR